MSQRVDVWRRVVAVFAAVVAVVVAGGAAAATLSYAFAVPVEQNLDYATDVALVGDAVTVTSDASEVQVARSPDSRLRVSVQGAYRGGEPAVTIGTGGSGVSVSCPDGKFWRCDLSLLVQVPVGTGVVVAATQSNVEVDGVDGDLTVATTIGSITVGDHVGTLTAKTSVGNVTISRARSSDISVDVARGFVNVDAVAAPTAIDVSSEYGDTIVTLPASVDYDVNAASNDGIVRVEVADNPASPHRVGVTTGQGDIRIGPR